MVAWSQRPVEIANLLNPAFTGILLRHSIDGYMEEKGCGMPYPLAFFVIPIVLHENTRKALPRGISTPMHAWLQQNPEVRIGFAERVRELLPYTKEALMFTMQLRVLTADQEGLLVPGERRPKSPNWRDSELDDFRLKPAFLGRWLARAGSAPTVFTMWGVRP